jgi:hypothetical protein
MAENDTVASYERDYHAWTFEQARRIRAGETIDRENVAEELEDLGRSQQQQLQNRFAVLLAHLLKWEFQPEKPCASWKATIKEQRIRIHRLLTKMPGLKPHLTESITAVYEIAVAFAAAESFMIEEDLPSECPYTPGQILDLEYLPNTE